MDCEERASSYASLELTIAKRSGSEEGMWSDWAMKTKTRIHQESLKATEPQGSAALSRRETSKSPALPEVADYGAL
jgi:hypothetical protein